MSNRWKPGVSGNPSGRTPIPEDLKDCTPTEIRAIIWRLWKFQPHRLKDILEDPKTPVGVLFIAQVLAKGIEQGDAGRLGFLLDRLVGKVKEVVEIQAQQEPMTLDQAKAVLDADYAVLPPKVVKVEDL